MKRENDEETFVGALLGDWGKFKDYWRSGQLFYELLGDGGYSAEPEVIYWGLGIMWLVQAVVGVILSWQLAISFLTCGLSLLILAGIIPLGTTLLFLRYMIYKADQWKNRNE